MGRLAERAFRRYYGEVYRFLLRRTADPGEAEELTQQVFTDAAASERQLERDQRPVLPWLLAVAHRRWVDERRRNRRQQDAFEAVGIGPLTDATSDGDVAVFLRGSLEQLPLQQRDVVVRRLLHGETFREIAAELELSEGAVKMRFHRGVETLRQDLREQGYGP
jgi:RNA polymerase sigma-70 factor, ECF subfamily